MSGSIICYSHNVASIIVFLNMPRPEAASRQPSAQAQPPHRCTAAQARSAPPARRCPSDSTRSAHRSPSSSATHRLNTDTASSDCTPAHCPQAGSPLHSPSSLRPSKLPSPTLGIPKLPHRLLAYIYEYVFTVALFNKVESRAPRCDMYVDY